MAKDTKKLALTSCMVIVDKALTGCKSLVQSSEKLEPLLAEAELACMNHAKTYGDVRPAARLINELPKHPSMKSIQFEIVAWFRANSPIWWDAKGECHLAKKGEPNFKAFDLEAASKEAFNERPAAKKARAAGAAAHKRNLEPATFEMLTSRVYGLKRWLESSQVPNEAGVIRGVDKDDKPLMEEAIKFVIAQFDTFRQDKGKLHKAPESGETEHDSVQPKQVKAA